MSLTQSHTAKWIPASLRPLVEAIFYGNYFYGICAVSIMLETAVQLRLELQGPLLFVMGFLVTVLFYTYPYISPFDYGSSNPRTQWFARHHNVVVANQMTLSLALVSCLVYLGLKYYQNIFQMGLLSWLLIVTFPLTGLLYYGINRLSRSLSLRQIGWLKPFLIGFVWAGLANAYPLVYAALIQNQALELSFFRGLLFVKTFMYISMLAIMFDIKDMEADQQINLQTWIVKLGLRRTLFYVIMPLVMLGQVTFLSYAFTQHFSLLKTCLILIPFILLMASTRLFEKHRSLLFYLSVIDGLIIVKAVFGILAANL